MAPHDNPLNTSGTRLRTIILERGKLRDGEEPISLWSDGRFESDNFVRPGESNHQPLPTRKRLSGALPEPPRKDPVGIGFGEHVRREQALAISIANHSPLGQEDRGHVEPPNDTSPSIPASFDPLEWGDEPDFQLGFKWLGRTSIPPREMSRHWMVFGETGSGKTRSVVIPLLGSLIRYGYKGTNP